MHPAMKKRMQELYPDKKIEDFYENTPDTKKKSKATNRHEPFEAKLARMHNICAEKNPHTPAVAAIGNQMPQEKSAAFEFAAAKKAKDYNFEL